MNQGRWKKVSGAMRRVLKRWAPPSRMTVSEWADRYRRLSSESSAEPGPWNTARAPYQREMMDVVNDPHIEEIDFITSSQVGKTEIIENIIGYFIDLDPCPMLNIQPTLEMGKAFSKDRLAPMLRDTPRLHGKVKDVKAKNSDNEILHKKFPGGHITIAGANSPASLAARPVRIAMFDEVSRFPASAGTEGDPLALGEKRTVTFWNRKKIRTSSPTEEGCRIEVGYEESDQRRYWVKCPHCGGMHLLEWANVIWEKTEAGEHLPETAAHGCPCCGALETDADLPYMLAKGEWRKGRPEVVGHAGFHINELYSPWVKFSETAAKWIKAQSDLELLKVFMNTALGLVWKDGKAIGEAETLLQRRENYDAELVPMGAVVITASVDVQEDRLEVDTVGWGLDRESWGLEHKLMWGDPAQPDVWKSLDVFLTKKYHHESGQQLRIVGCGIDSGYCTSEVYAFCKPRWGRHIYALKGDGGPKKPLVAASAKNNALRLFRVGTDTVKDLFAHHLATIEPGPGYCHFPHTFEKEYFEQLLAERPTVKTVNGARIRAWRKKTPATRNEALDNRIYNYAALALLGIDLNATVEWFQKRAGFEVAQPPEKKSTGRKYRSKGVAA